MSIVERVSRLPLQGRLRLFGKRVEGYALFRRVEGTGKCEFNRFRLFIDGTPYGGHVCGEEWPARNEKLVDEHTIDGYDRHGNPFWINRFTDAFVFDPVAVLEPDGHPAFGRELSDDRGSFMPRPSSEADCFTADGTTTLTLEHFEQPLHGTLRTGLVEIKGGSGVFKGARGLLTYHGDPWVVGLSPLRVEGWIIAKGLGADGA